MSNRFPPNKADPIIKVPLRPAEKIYQNLKKLGLMAEDLGPIDWRKSKQLKKGAEDILEPQSQGQCGCCWAMSSTTTLTDLFRIYKGIKGLHLESLLTMQCAKIPNNTGCCGGSPYYAGLFFKDTGCVHVDKPFDYSQVGNESTTNPSCVTSNVETCNQIMKNLNMDNNKNIYKINEVITTVCVKNGNIDSEATLLAMKVALSKGPIVATFIVFNDFMKVKNEVYVYDGQSNFDGCHAVEIVGWDIDSENKMPYWIIKNSWGTEIFGDKGYCKFAMYPFNKGLCLDVPDSTYFDKIGIKSLSEDDTGLVDDKGNPIFGVGGGIEFVIDDETGADTGHSYGNTDDNQDNSVVDKHTKKNYLKIILIICLIILIVLIGIYFLKADKKRKKIKS